MVVLITSSGWRRRGSASCLGSATSVERETYLSQRGDLEHVQASAEQQIAELDGLLLELRRGGHLSSGRHLVYGDALKGALTKGCWGLRRLLRDRGRMWRGEGGEGLAKIAKEFDERKKQEGSRQLSYRRMDKVSCIWRSTHAIGYWVPPIPP
jgi:hypothetical protein